MTDQALLTDYRRGRPGAFRELLERHAGLVYGVAWRVTRDRTLAEDAMQDAFCLLAKKSAALMSHPNLAGWLHRTALNVGRDLARRRAQHERKLARFARHAEVSVATGPPPTDWESIDAAIDRLPAEERAVVLLRFFEELDHSAIAQRLGISETAARKRLSRGLARLQKTLAAPTGGLAMTAPPAAMASVWTAVPASPPAAGLFPTLTLMTHKQLAAAAAIALTGCGLTWFGASQWQEKQRLTEELASLRMELAGPPPARPTPSTPGATASVSSDRSSEIESLRTELAAEVEKRSAVERELAALKVETDPLRDQVVVAFGKVNEIGSSLGSLFTEARALVEIEKTASLDTPENQVRLAKFIESAASISGLSKEIVEFEDKPEEGSRFVAAAYGSAFDLDEAEQARVAEFFSRTLAEANEKEVTLSHLPDRGSAEFGPWLEKRWAYFNSRRDALRALIPENKQAGFDQWIEKGSYGFNNLTLKGMPLMFSLGGDPR